MWDNTYEAAVSRPVYLNGEPRNCAGENGRFVHCGQQKKAAVGDAHWPQATNPGQAMFTASTTWQQRLEGLLKPKEACTEPLGVV